MNPLKFFRRGGAAFFALAFCVSISAAQAQLAPGAGGYNSEFGTDYRVGMAQRSAVRAPIFVVGIRAQTTRGAQQNWIAPRFADALSRKLGSVLGASAPLPQVTSALSQHGLRAENLGGAALQSAAQNNAKSALPLRRAMLFLRREYSPQRAAKIIAKKGGAQLVSAEESAPLLALCGDIMLNGPLQSASTKITVALRVVRFNAEDLSASPSGAFRVGAMRMEPISAITLRAPARDFAQLPARCVLALSDAMPFSLSSRQRAALLRAASPLTPAASPARLRYETRVGDAVSQAMNAQFAWNQAQRAPAASRAALLQNAATSARRAQNMLRVLAVAPSLPEPDRVAANEAAQSAREWLAPLETIARSAPASTRAPRR